MREAQVDCTRVVALSMLNGYEYSARAEGNLAEQTGQGSSCAAEAARRRRRGVAQRIAMLTTSRERERERGHYLDKGK